ncbi:hypothetical protein [Sorangium sp. So ce128]|uniref:hypothetical protein n=1 Tax=Sorangium sp. So ce128 TaxID=3133281 RepID=UPI003F5FB680
MSSASKMEVAEAAQQDRWGCAGGRRGRAGGRPGLRRRTAGAAQEVAEAAQEGGRDRAAVYERRLRLLELHRLARVEALLMIAAIRRDSVKFTGEIRARCR